MEKIKKYIISKIKEIISKYPNLEIRFGKSEYLHNYTIFIGDSEVYNSKDFMNYEGEITIEFIDKFNSDYSLFFTDDKDYFDVDKVEFEHKNNCFKQVSNKLDLNFDTISHKECKDYLNLQKINFKSINSVLNLKNKNKFKGVISNPNFKGFIDKNIQELINSHCPIIVSNFITEEITGNEEYALAA